MTKEKNVVLINGLSKPMSSIGINTTNEQIVFSGRGDIKEILTKNLVTDDGRTVGERHRAELHLMLDEWLDGTWRDAPQVAPPCPTLAQSEQDCVGWFGYDTGLRLWFEANKGDDGAIPLYKDPPQRPWVGLTETEVSCLWLQTSPYFHEEDFARAIEAKLKEKNGG